MRISVITVARNAAATIGDTVRSVAAQDYADIEHLVIDGASTDGTRAAVEAVASPRTVFVSAPDRGLYDAMNKGVARATGDIIGFLNADDFFCRTDAISLIGAAARNNPDDAAVSGGIAIVDAARPDRLRRAYPAVSFRPWMLRFGHMPPHPGFYARSTAIARVGPFDLSFMTSADFDWMVRFFAVFGLRSAMIPATLVTLRDGGLSNRGFDSRLRINNDARASLRRNGMSAPAVFMWLKYALKMFQLGSRPYQWPAPESIRFDIPRISSLLDNGRIG